jgi:hypothetical protein
VESDLPGGIVVGTTAGALADSTAVNSLSDPMPSPVANGMQTPNSVNVAPSAADAGAPAPPAPNGKPDFWSAVGQTGTAPPNPTSNCCGPVGADGGIGQEIYARFGWSCPRGDGRLAFNLEKGYTAQIGSRSLFFDPAGTCAWAVDAHVVYTHNRGFANDIHTLNTEPVTVRDLHRTAVGLGLGRDWFSARPGFILDTWDTNFRLGLDVGGRWGAGHVDFDTPFELEGYRRRYDVFGQAFAGALGTAEVPIGGWTMLFGGRVEWIRTFSDLLPKDANFDEFTATLILGVRY